MSEVFAEVQGAGPLAGVVRVPCPLPKKILYSVGIRYTISLLIFVKNFLILPPNYYAKTWFKAEKTTFENERTKN